MFAIIIDQCNDIILNRQHLINFGDSISRECDEFRKSMYETMTDVIAENCTDNPVLVKKVKDFGAIWRNRIDKIYRTEGVFNCIIHNDTWGNNFMFK
jgi:hypothetical protein